MQVCGAMDAAARHRALEAELHQSYVNDVIRLLRRCDWVVRHMYFRSLKRINPQVADEVAGRMGPDELYHGTSTGVSPPAVIPLGMMWLRMLWVRRGADGLPPATRRRVE